MRTARWLLLAAGYAGAFVFAVAATGALWGMAAAGWARKRRGKGGEP